MRKVERQDDGDELLRMMGVYEGHPTRELKMEMMGVKCKVEKQMERLKMEYAPLDMEIQGLQQQLQLVDDAMTKWETLLKAVAPKPLT